MLAIIDFCAAASCGTGSGNGPGAAPGVSPHVTGSLRCTPRGSNVTTSKSSSSCGVSVSSSLTKSSIPDTPGPPGLMTNDPLRRIIGEVALHGDPDRAALRVVIVERNDQRSTLEAPIALRPRDRSDGQRWLCRCGGGGDRRCRRRGGVAGPRHRGRWSPFVPTGGQEKGNPDAHGQNGGKPTARPFSAEGSVHRFSVPRGGRDQRSP